MSKRRTHTNDESAAVIESIRQAFPVKPGDNASRDAHGAALAEAMNTEKIDAKSYADAVEAMHAAFTADANIA